MIQERFVYLINQFAAKTISPEELEELQQILHYTEQPELSEALSAEWLREIASIARQPFDRSESDRQAEMILGIDKVPASTRVRLLPKWSWAAAIILLIGAAIAVIVSSDTKKNVVVASADILPGTNKAVLTVGSRSFNLSNSKTGIAVGSSITYNDGERIADAGQMIKVSTPRGGQYQAVLPDGSKVWLNAASSIKFPSQFHGASRIIEVTGEAYLEVSKNANQPFSVLVNGATVNVLGTGFNINAYGENIKTTLVNGSVKVNGVVLEPRQQAIVRSPKDVKVVNADLEQTLAWKNGFISFDAASFAEVMQQIERWYDINVKYEGAIPSVHIEGRMDRGVQLSDLIYFLNGFGIHARLEGRTLFVSPQ